ncbi:iron-containing alcohol dehydrogenase family protein [Prauserella muralis]|uniref:Methanol dehydrogenase n=1 Tax=Prauserella muralis TaxID=588067 RepID=A0A2V4ATI9_9PSEU|nr:iron-containing alcohol dehydrogenase [Prauserella muralis]PXY24657.1 methanol dehydrogenase [Prauserella muralis]TWE27653.1 alcohol dehydrogenase [Prauserella muralis]
MNESFDTPAGTALRIEPHAHIDFGASVVEHLPDAVDRVGHRRAFVVTDQGMRATGILGKVLAILDRAGIETACYEGVEPNPTTRTVDEGAAEARRFGAAAVVAVGGGSALDAAKGIAIVAANTGVARDFDYTAEPPWPGLPVIAVPTTAGTGAETNGFGVLEDPARRCKVYIGHASVRPRFALLDPELTVGLPPRATAATGMDALVHGIESLAAKGANPVSAAYATQAIRLVGSSLATAVDDGTDLEARSRLIMGAHLAGLALTLSGLGLVHGIAHSVTNHTGAVHGLALTSVLDRVMQWSADVAAAPYALVAQAMGLPGSGNPDQDAAVAIGAVRDLAEDVGARLPLRELGVDAGMIPGIARGALDDIVSVNHPKEFSGRDVETILTAAL